MALTGELSDLSLAELIEFFCNQRKTGRLKVVYANGPGYFYLQSGSVVHARIGELRGIEAVFYALTLPNASFTFSPAFEPPEQTIHQPWASLVLEGLRRMDEGIAPRNAFPDTEEKTETEPEPLAAAAPLVDEKPVDEKKETFSEATSPEEHVAPEFKVVTTNVSSFVPEFATDLQRSGRTWKVWAVVAAVVLSIAVVGVPWGWYAHNKAAKLANEANETKPLSPDNVQPPATADTNETASDPSPESNSATAAAVKDPASSVSDADDLARRQREARARERAKMQETAATSSNPPATANPTTTSASTSAPKAQSSPANTAKRVTVQVTYDENGRVTQASGGDANALRIARQKRFPAGKAGSATITIPIN